MCVCFRDLKLRNYAPEDEELKQRQVPKAKPASGENRLIPVLLDPTGTFDKIIYIVTITQL